MNIQLLDNASAFRYVSFTSRLQLIEGREMTTLKQQLGYILLGFVFWLPIGVAVLVISYFLGSLEDLGKEVMGIVIPDRFLYTGLGVAFWIIVMFLTGLLLKATAVGKYASAIPILGTFFLRLEGETMTIDKLMHMTPCLFLYSPTCLSYGWVLAEQKVTLDKDQSQIELLNVYYPNVPTILTGQVFAVRKETVIKLGNSSREIFDVLLYGLRQPQQIEYLPWDNEDGEAFSKRAETFGILPLLPDAA